MNKQRHLDASDELLEQPKNKSEIIAEIAKNKLIENIIHSFTNSPYSNDLAQDLYVDLLGKDEVLIMKLYKNDQLEYYIRKMIRLNLNSNTSRYYRNYIKFRKITNNIDEEKRI